MFCLYHFSWPTVSLIPAFRTLDQNGSPITAVAWIVASGAVINENKWLFRIYLLLSQNHSLQRIWRTVSLNTTWPIKLHFAEQVLLCVLLASKAWLVGRRGRAFLIVAPRLWNFLARDAHLAPSLVAFHCHLKMELFCWASYELWCRLALSKKWVRNAFLWFYAVILL